MGGLFYIGFSVDITDNNNMLQQSCRNMFQIPLQALFTCCLEIVIFSYNSQRTFPWVLETFKLEAVHFYKVIEVIIRAEDWLPRDVVKHLQRIEEQILESRAWTKDSPLWDAIEKDPQGVPSCEEVSLPHPPGSGMSNVDHHLDVTQSPLSHHERAFTVMRCKLVFYLHLTEFAIQAALAIRGFDYSRT